MNTLLGKKVKSIEHDSKSSGVTQIIIALVLLFLIPIFLLGNLISLVLGLLVFLLLLIMGLTNYFKKNDSVALYEKGIIINNWRKASEIYREDIKKIDFKKKLMVDRFAIRSCEVAVIHTKDDATYEAPIEVDKEMQQLLKNLTTTPRIF